MADMLGCCGVVVSYCDDSVPPMHVRVVPVEGGRAVAGYLSEDTWLALERDGDALVAYYDEVLFAHCGGLRLVGEVFNRAAASAGLRPSLRGVE